MSVGVCSICGKFTKAGGLCERHAKAYYDYAEEGKYCEEGGDEIQERD